MGVKPYVSAVEALPEELLRAISAALGGREAFLWIPAARSFKRHDRDVQIAALRERGYAEADIADRLCCSTRTVRRAARRMREKAQGAQRLPSRRGQGGNR